MGAAPAKFLFDLDFSGPSARPHDGADVAAAEARGYRAGFEAAQREMASLTEQRMTQALCEVAAALRGISGGFAATAATVEHEAIGVAVEVGRKLAGALMAAEPLGQIAALVQDCIRHLVATPHLVVRVNDALYDEARTRLDETARHSGFQGKLVILADPDIAGGDCRIEWADGGVVLDQREVQTRIAELVDRYMTCRPSDRLHTRNSP
jgi:flagellar assembly protein FliH